MKRFTSDHERAFELSCMAFADSISENERNWIQNHLANCVECSVRIQQTDAAEDSFRQCRQRSGAGNPPSSARIVPAR